MILESAVGQPVRYVIMVLDDSLSYLNPRNKQNRPAKKQHSYESIPLSRHRPVVNR